MSRQLLADVVLVAHAVIVLFNIGSLPVIWLGAYKGWGFVRNFYFRATHLFLIGFVAAETVLGVVCPLTLWEDTLRGGQSAADAGGFIAHWVGRLIYYDLAPWIFTAAYAGFFVLVFCTWFVVKPDPRSRSSRRGNKPA